MRDELTNLMRTFEALGPLVGHAVKSGQLVKPRCELTEPNVVDLGGELFRIHATSFVPVPSLSAGRISLLAALVAGAGVWALGSGQRRRAH